MFVSFFQYSSAVLVLVTAAAKLISALGAQGILHAPDPILGVSNRVLLMSFGILELTLVAALLGSEGRWFVFLLISMLGGQFLLYRTIFALGAYSRGCPCLGTIGEWLPMSERNIDLALWGIASWLCIGGAISCYLSFQNVAAVQAASESTASG